MRFLLENDKSFGCNRMRVVDESKNRSMTSVSTLQELGSQMMEFYSNTFGFVERYRHIIEILIEMNS